MSRYDFKSPRLFVRENLRPGEHIGADPQQANYLVNVLRLKPGASVLAFNGRDGEWRTAIVEAGRRNIGLEVIERVREQTAPSRLVLAFAPLKHARLDYMVQKAVEMGAGVLQPIRTQHGQVTRLNSDRMEANAIEAAEQCGVLSIPGIREMIPLSAFAETFEGTLIFCDEDEQAAPLDALSHAEGNTIAIVIGPEGGFSEDERQFLRALPSVRPISLGPRILRADTAAVAALALVQARLGDWR